MLTSICGPVLRPVPRVALEAVSSRAHARHARIPGQPEAQRRREQGIQALLLSKLAKHHVLVWLGWPQTGLGQLGQASAQEARARLPWEPRKGQLALRLRWVHAAMLRCAGDGW